MLMLFDAFVLICLCELCVSTLNKHKYINMTTIKILGCIDRKMHFGD